MTENIETGSSGDQAPTTPPAAEPASELSPSAAAPVAPTASNTVGPPLTPEIATPSVKSPEDRKATLSQSIARAVAGGGRVESQSDYQAIIVTGKKVNHLLHFFIGVFTIGAWWLFVWLPLAIFGGEKREIIQVDDYGNALVQKT